MYHRQTTPQRPQRRRRGPPLHNLVAGGDGADGGALRREAAISGDEGRRARPGQHPRRVLPGHDVSSSGRPASGMVMVTDRLGADVVLYSIK